MSIYGKSEVGTVGAGVAAGTGVVADVEGVVVTCTSCSVLAALTPPSSPPHAATAKTSNINEFKRALRILVSPSRYMSEATIAGHGEKIDKTYT